jgi:crotonobetainyl-CoA:carnitine CoA-transferase CaiB-like acyl-CoA transferase
LLARVTGFGQISPYRRRPGFGTLAQAMSGFATATGEPDGPPTLPPFGLADQSWFATGRGRADHTEAVLAELGYPVDDIAELRRSGAAGGPDE